MNDKLTPLQVLICCFSIASLAGIAALLRSNKDLNVRTITSATLYSGLFGLVIGLIWYNYFAPTNLFFLIGVSGLAGLGGVSLLDVVLQLITNGVNVRISVEPDDEDTEVDDDRE
jgi:hypothetical protein